MRDIRRGMEPHREPRLERGRLAGQLACRRSPSQRRWPQSHPPRRRKPGEESRWEPHRELRRQPNRRRGRLLGRLACRRSSRRQRREMRRERGMEHGRLSGQLVRRRARRLRRRRPIRRNWWSHLARRQPLHLPGRRRLRLPRRRLHMPPRAVRRWGCGCFGGWPGWVLWGRRGCWGLPCGCWCGDEFRLPVVAGVEDCR